MLIKELKIWLTAISIPAFCWYLQIAQNDVQQYHEDSVVFMQTNYRSCDAQARGKELGLFDSARNQEGIAHLTAYYLLHPDDR
jgi:hypothetical protein